MNHPQHELDISQNPFSLDRLYEQQHVAMYFDVYVKTYSKSEVGTASRMLYECGAADRVWDAVALFANVSPTYKGKTDHAKRLPLGQKYFSNEKTEP